jgi:hypothetical protein
MAVSDVAPQNPTVALLRETFKKDFIRPGNFNREKTRYGINVSEIGREELKVFAKLQKKIAGEIRIRRSGTELRVSFPI